MTEELTFHRTIEITAAASESVRALTTVAGIRAWWSPVVTGSCGPGAELTVGFEGLDEQILLRVEPCGDPALVRWTCLEHGSAPRWKGSVITFSVSDRPGGTSLAVEHRGVPAAEVAAGWDRFLRSIAQLVETGIGEPYRAPNANPSKALAVALEYHEAWTSRDFTAARALLSDDLRTDVPINTYADADDFASAVESFGGAASNVDLIASFGADNEALLLYDMTLPGLADLRIAEHFTVADRRITHIRHVHDTAALASA